MLIAEEFIISLVTKYGKPTVYSGGGTWCVEACTVIGLKNYLHLPFQKSLMERVRPYLTDRIESFDDYYLCRSKEENTCNLFHVYDWVQFSVSMYNGTIANNNNDFVLKDVNVILNKEPFFVQNCNMNGVSNDRLYPN